MANELDFPDPDTFFSNDEFLEKETSFIMENSDEDFSPKQTPRERNNTINDQLEMMSMDSGS